MARANTRPAGGSSSPRLASQTPPPSDGSDQENYDPAASTRPKGRARDMPNLPTPTSDGSHGQAGSNGGHGQKRKRVAEAPDRLGSDAPDELDEAERKFSKYYDPRQDLDVRRELKRKSRALERNFHENRDGFLRGDGNAFTETVDRANRIYKEVKQTNDATLDSRLLVNVSDLAHKKTAQLVLGDTSTGVDVDEFLSKCITYMRGGDPDNRPSDSTSSSRTARRRRTQYYDDDDEDSGEPLEWALLGRDACFPYNNRPAVPSFLLGPLSVEKKQRAFTQRRAKQSHATAGNETRPEALTVDDMQQSDENSLTTICHKLRADLMRHIKRAKQTLHRAGFTEQDIESEHGKAMLRKCRVSRNGGISIFHAALNPRSFGQTVENLFYLSFLIKEGAIGIDLDEDEMPTIMPTGQPSLEERRGKQIQRHQAVFAIDYGTWQKLVHALDIQDPMIPHREEEDHQQVGTRGWYA